MPDPASIYAEGFKTTPYWWEEAKPTAIAGAALPDATDIAVVGSGYAGLAAALELRREGVDVTVLEAKELGWGASSRSGGMVSSGVNVGKGGNVERDYGTERMADLLEEAGNAFDHLIRIIEREKIDCQFAQTGRFVGAHSPAAFREQAKKVDALNAAADAGVEMIPRERQKEEVNTDFYHGGMNVDLSGGLHPAKLHKGVLEACKREGVRLCANTMVGKITKTEGGFTVETSKGTIKAREVVIATNGYTGDITPKLRNKVVPVASYIIATEELGEEKIKELFPNFRMIADSKRVLYYYRPSPDRKRVIFGGRARFSPHTPEQAAPIMYDYMCGIFPQLRGVKITHSWNGNVAFTWDRLPHTGLDQESGLHYCLGCNGSGVVMMTHLGHQTALKILGKTNRLSSYDGLNFDPIPLYNGNPWFLPMVGTYYRFRDWLDRSFMSAD